MAIVASLIIPELLDACHQINICGFLLGAIRFGIITLVDLLTADPSSFTLIGDTRGGPPEISTWTRNGQVISDSDSYSISLEVNEVNRIDVFMDDFDDRVLRQSRYRSTLTVTGNLPGVYVYSVINRALSTPRTTNFTIEGIGIDTDHVLNPIDTMIIIIREPLS